MKSLLLFPLLFLTAPLLAAAPSLQQQAEAAYAQRADLHQAHMAYALFQHALTLDSKNAELCGEASRAAWWVAEHSTDRAEKLAVFDQGAQWAQQGIALNPNLPILHFWLGANWGSYGESKGILKSLALVKPIRKEMATVLQLDERYNGGGGYRVLGVVDYKVPGIAGGSKKRSLEELQKAMAIDSQNFFNRYYLAEYYWTIGERDKAKAELAVLSTLKAPMEDQPELQMMQKKGEALAAKL